MSKLGEFARRCLGLPSIRQPDYVLDNWIREALVEEARARPPAGAWDRLRLAVAECKHRNYGMWVLDEPPRDPPESPPMLLNGSQFERALRIYGGRARGYERRDLPLNKEALWGGLIPTLSTLLNL
jgi:hypothetical protein